MSATPSRRPRWPWIASLAAAGLLLLASLAVLLAVPLRRGAAGRPPGIPPGARVLDRWSEWRGGGGAAVRVDLAKVAPAGGGPAATVVVASVPAGAPAAAAGPRRKLDPLLARRFAEARARGAGPGFELDAIVWHALPDATRRALERLALDDGEEFEPPASAAPARFRDPDEAAAAVRVVQARAAGRRARVRAAMESATASFLDAAGIPAARQVRRFATAPAAAVRLSEAEALRLAALPQVNYVFAERRAEKELDLVGPALRAPTAWGEGTDGGGVAVAHIEPEPGRIETNNPYLAAASYRPAADIDPHATAIAGILRSTHESFRGVAHGCTLLGANAASDGETDLIAATDWALAQGASVVNMSYGLSDPSTNEFTWSDIYFDYMVHYQRVLFTKSAGNQGGSLGYVTSPGLGYNSLAVGAIDGQGTASWTDDVMKVSSSYVDSPAGTEKPETVAYGEDLWTTLTASPWIGGGHNGTSFAAPQVAAIAALCIDRTPELADEPAALKAKILASGLARNIEGNARLSEYDGAGAALAAAVRAGSYARTVVSNDFGASGWLELPVAIPLASNDPARVVLVCTYPPTASNATPDASSYLKADLDLYLYLGTNLATSSTFGAQNPFEIADYHPAAAATGTVKVKRESWDAGLAAMRIGLAYVSRSELGSAADGEPGTAPPAPSGLSARAGTNSGEVVLGWIATPGAGGYNLFYDEDAENPPYGPDDDGSPASGGGAGGASATQVVVAALMPGQLYHFALQATNATGAGALSVAIAANAALAAGERGFNRTAAPTLDGVVTDRVARAGGALLSGSFPFLAKNATGDAAQVVAVVGLVSPGGAWVGGEPLAVYTGVPSSSGTAGAAAWTNLAVPTIAATSAVRYAAYWTNDAAAAVAAFKVSPPSADTGRTSGRVGEVTTTYDADGDGMPDWWERVYGGGPTNLSPGGHSDADGSPDLDEWLGGTNPTNAASYLRFDAATAEGGSAVRLSWAGATNRVYGLSRATNLAVASYAGVATNLPPAFPRTSYTDTVGTATGPFFYRLEARPTE